MNKKERNLLTDKQKLHKINILVVEGLTIDGSHHKQWYLERIAEYVGLDIEALVIAGMLEPGIAP